MSEPLEGAFEPSADTPLTALGYPTSYPAPDAHPGQGHDQIDDGDDVDADDVDDADDGDGAATTGAPGAPRKRRRRGSRGGRNRNRQRREAEEGATAEGVAVTPAPAPDKPVTGATALTPIDENDDDSERDGDASPHGPAAALRGLIRRPQIGDTRP